MRYICIHGHFYQPPRENASLGEIEAQPSAHPFHNWNARVCAESYAQMGRAKIMSAHDPSEVEKRMNNYAHISFNFGPTLHSWLHNKDPQTSAKIIEADHTACHHTGGHGTAMAQVYNHLIMPLATPRTKELQVKWGIADFMHRFGRRPKGMWLAETAVDTETLEVLAAYGITFTLLAPRQAQAIRPAPDQPWQDVRGSRVDPKRPYQCVLPSGNTITLFFYDGPTSRAVAFEGLLHNGEVFAERLISCFDPHTTEEPQLVHIATDGESYGHHHRYGEMGLAYALKVLQEREDVEVVHYEEFLSLHPATWQVQIVEESSWSCEHGVERWRKDCGCHTGGEPGWDQSWRVPLRRALDTLRDQTRQLIAQSAPESMHHPEAAEEHYIQVLLGEVTRQDFAQQHFKPAKEKHAWIMLEIQHHLMLMFTSCGWFFNDLEGIETIQILEYADHVIHLAKKLWSENTLEHSFLEIFDLARSNQGRSGKQLWQEEVKSKRYTTLDVAKAIAMLGPETSLTWQSRWQTSWRTFKECRGVRLCAFDLHTLWESTSWSLVAEYNLHDGSWRVTQGGEEDFQALLNEERTLDASAKDTPPLDVALELQRRHLAKITSLQVSWQALRG